MVYGLFVHLLYFIMKMTENKYTSFRAWFEDILDKCFISWNKYNNTGECAEIDQIRVESILYLLVPLLSPTGSSHGSPPLYHRAYEKLHIQVLHSSTAGVYVKPLCCGPMIRTYVKALFSFTRAKREVGEGAGNLKGKASTDPTCLVTRNYHKAKSKKCLLWR